jgi:hypothetical protein
MKCFQIVRWGDPFHASQHLTSLDFPFLVYIKNAVYGAIGQLNSRKTLKHRITVAVETIVP